MTNQIEEIQKLYAKTKRYKIPQHPKEGQEQITIEMKPLSLDNLGQLNVREDAPISETAENAKKLFAVSLEITEDEASKISVEFMEDLMDALMDANNLNEKDLEKTGLKSFMEQKKAQLKIQGENAKSTGKA